MKENRLGPRQWAFVVVTGGAVFALPFMQRQPEAKPERPIVDATAALLPESLSRDAQIPATLSAAPASAQTDWPSPAGQPTSTGATSVQASASVSSEAKNSIDPLADPSVPAWPVLPHSPFDDMVQQKAIVVDAKPTEEIVPMQPLRPWISAPNLSSNSSSSHNSGASLPSSTAPTSSSHAASAGAQTLASASSKGQSSAMAASPWRDDASDDVQPEQAIAQSYGHGRRQLSVAAGPADQYTYEEIAQKLNLPKPELASAIVSADEVLPPPIVAQPSSPASVPKSSVVLSRQSPPRPLGAQVRFGQADNQAPSSMSGSTMVPLPTLPEERRGHIIRQPK